MSFARVLSLIHTYATWFYAVSFIALLVAAYQVRDARKHTAETIFALEKEFAAARERRACTSLLVVLALLALLTVIEFAVVPSQPIPPLPEPTRTRMVIELPTAVPVTPTPTLTRIPTRPRPTPRTPTATPTASPVPPPPCPQPGVCIVSPPPGQIVKGEVAIQGTATMEGFQFFKVEYGLGEAPERWNSIGDVSRTPVLDGTLALWNATGFPPGVYQLRLTVVDVTGNWAQPYQVQVMVGD